MTWDILGTVLFTTWLGLGPNDYWLGMICNKLLVTWHDLQEMTYDMTWTRTKWFVTWHGLYIDLDVQKKTCYQLCDKICRVENENVVCSMNNRCNSVENDKTQQILLDRKKRCGVRKNIQGWKQNIFFFNLIFIVVELVLKLNVIGWFVVTWI
jgi:hypothetical protein